MGIERIDADMLNERQVQAGLLQTRDRMPAIAASGTRYCPL